MFPGLGVGGYCLTKDPLLASWAKESFFDSSSGLSMSTRSVSTNDQMPIFAYKRLIEVFGEIQQKSVAFLGVSYRGDVGDTHFTPVQPLFRLVKSKAKKVTLHDPYVVYWEEDCKVENNLSSVLADNPQLVILSAGHTNYKTNSTLGMLLDIPSAMIFDTIGIFDEQQISILKTKHQVSVLGRGDITINGK